MSIHQTYLFFRAYGNGRIAAALKAIRFKSGAKVRLHP